MEKASTSTSDLQPPAQTTQRAISDERPDGSDSDVEAQKNGSHGVSHWRIVASQSLVTDAVLKHKYHGSGTADDPYLVEFIPNDPRNPMEFPAWKKWFLIAVVAMTTLAVAFVSTAYTASIKQIVEDFECSLEVATLGLSLFVFGWSVGPLIWVCCTHLCISAARQLTCHRLRCRSCTADSTSSSSLTPLLQLSMPVLPG